MGAFTPVEGVDPELLAAIEASIMLPTITAMAPLPVGGEVRHAEPFGIGDRRAPGVLWKVFTHASGELDERSAWPVKEV